MKCPEQKLMVISSFANDRITYIGSGKTFERIGGPAFWISKTLKDMGARFDMITEQKKAEVDIKIDKNGEKGVIRSVNRILLKTKMTADFIIISTIADEFDLENNDKYLEGEVAIDLQGYVRSSKLKSKKFVLPKNIEKKIKIIKLTREELSFLENKFICSYPNILFIVTNGKFGADIIKNDVTYHYDALKLEVADTLGAGDVFLAAFTARYIKFKDIHDSGNFANHYVHRFLINNKCIKV